MAAASPADIPASARKKGATKGAGARYAAVLALVVVVGGTMGAVVPGAAVVVV